MYVEQYKKRQDTTQQYNTMIYNTFYVCMHAIITLRCIQTLHTYVAAYTYISTKRPHIHTYCAYCTYVHYIPHTRHITQFRLHRCTHTYLHYNMLVHAYIIRYTHTSMMHTSYITYVAHLEQDTQIILRITRITINTQITPCLKTSRRMHTYTTLQYIIHTYVHSLNAYVRTYTLAHTRTRTRIHYMLSRQITIQ